MPKAFSTKSQINKTIASKTAPKAITAKTPAPKDSLEMLAEKANEAFSRLFNKISWGRKYPRDYGTGELLHMAEIEVLDRIANGDDVTMTHLAEQLGVSKAAISPVVNKLEAKGYLAKTVSPHHSNVRYLSLTAKGKIASRGVKRYQQRLHRYLHGVSKSELEAYIKLLGRMEEFVDGLHDELRTEFNIERSRS